MTHYFIPDRVNIYGKVPIWFVRDSEKENFHFKSFKQKRLHEDLLLEQNGLKEDIAHGNKEANFPKTINPQAASMFYEQTISTEPVLNQAYTRTNTETLSTNFVQNATSHFVSAQIPESTNIEGEVEGVDGKEKSSAEITNEDIIRRRKLEREKNGEVDYPELPKEFQETENGRNETETGGHKEKAKCLVFELLEGIAEFGKGLSIVSTFYFQSLQFLHTT